MSRHVQAQYVRRSIPTAFSELKCAGSGSGPLYSSETQHRGITGVSFSMDVKCDPERDLLLRYIGSGDEGCVFC